MSLICYKLYSILVRFCIGSFSLSRRLCRQFVDIATRKKRIHCIKVICTEYKFMNTKWWFCKQCETVAIWPENAWKFSAFVYRFGKQNTTNRTNKNGFNAKIAHVMRVYNMIDIKTQEKSCSRIMLHYQQVTCFHFRYFFFSFLRTIFVLFYSYNLFLFDNFTMCCNPIHCQNKHVWTRRQLIKSGFKEISYTKSWLEE